MNSRGSSILGDDGVLVTKIRPVQGVVFKRTLYSEKDMDSFNAEYF